MGEQTTLPAWFAIVLWMSLGTSMIMFNKVLLTTWGFNFPFFVTTWHCTLASILTQILSRTTNLLPGVKEGKVSIQNYFQRIVPLSACMAIALVLGNTAYRYISLAYIQMIKAFTPVPLLLLYFLLGREKASLTQLSIVLVISLGVYMSSVGELHFSLIGFIVQLGAVCADCFRMILLEILVKDLKLDSLSLLYYTTPTSAVLIAAGFLFVESARFSLGRLSPIFCLVLLANGCLAFSLNIAILFLVQSTSALVMSVCGPIKDILIVVFSIAVFHSPITILQVTGFGISLCGLYLYRQYKADPDYLRTNVMIMLDKTLIVLGVRQNAFTDEELQRSAEYELGPLLSENSVEQ